MKVKIVSWIFLVIGTILLGTFLMIGTYAGDTEETTVDLKSIQKQMKRESEYQKLGDTESSKLDNFTDSLMILTAAYSGPEDTLEKSMRNYRFYKEGKSPYKVLTTTSKFENMEKASYERYWHGYLIFLKPLLKNFDYVQIRILNAIVQGALIITLMLILYQKKLTFCIVPLFSIYLILNPFSLANSLQYSTIWYIILISLLIYLIFQEKIKKKQLHFLFFTLVGMLTSYFDLLTYPITTLGILLILVIMTEDLNIKETLKRIIFCCIAWGLGYGIMWASKWIIASLVLNENVLANAKETIQSRSSNVLNSGREISRFDTFKRVFSKIDKDLILNLLKLNIVIPFVCFVLNKINKFLKKRKHVKQNFEENVECKIKDETKQEIEKNIKKEVSTNIEENMQLEKRKMIRGKVKCILIIIANALLILSIGLLPIVWYFILANHSYAHTFLSFRTSIILWFAIFMTCFKIKVEIEKFRDKKGEI